MPKFQNYDILKNGNEAQKPVKSHSSFGFTTPVFNLNSL